jgi:chromate transporter
MGTPTLRLLAVIFGRVGLLTFGGGDPTVAALHTEFVTARQWLSQQRYAMAFALARVTPGTNVLAFCAGAAWQMLGWAGAVVAVLAAAAPSAVLAVLFTVGYQGMQRSAAARAAIAGLLAAAVGLMATAAWQLLAPNLRGSRHQIVRTLAILGPALWLAVGMHMPPIPVLALGALAGFLWQVPEKA